MQSKRASGHAGCAWSPAPTSTTPSLHLRPSAVLRQRHGERDQQTEARRQSGAERATDAGHARSLAGAARTRCCPRPSVRSLSGTPCRQGSRSWRTGRTARGERNGLAGCHLTARHAAMRAPRGGRQDQRATSRLARPGRSPPCRCPTCCLCLSCSAASQGDGPPIKALLRGRGGGRGDPTAAQQAITPAYQYSAEPGRQRIGRRSENLAQSLVQRCDLPVTASLRDRAGGLECAMTRRPGTQAGAFF
jgi:hypothetical protein